MTLQVNLLSSACLNKFFHPIKIILRFWIVAQTWKNMPHKIKLLPVKLHCLGAAGACCLQIIMSHVDTAAATIFFLATNLLPNAYRIDFIFQELDICTHTCYLCLCHNQLFVLLILPHGNGTFYQELCYFTMIL